MADFGSARKWARALIEANVGAGARIVDGTMGNGYDTEWLAGLAGKDGHVFGFDIQPEAVERTRTRLEAAGLLERATLICDGHQKLAEYVKEPLDAAVFNLGCCPQSARVHDAGRYHASGGGSGAFAFEARRRSDHLRVPGSRGGHAGARRAASMGGALDDGVYDAMAQEYLNIRKKPPLLIAVTKR